MLDVGASRWLGRWRAATGAAFGAAIGAALVLGAAREARAADFEVAPWLGWAAGVEWYDGGPRALRRRDPQGLFLLNVGLEATTATWVFGGGSGGAFEVRMGPWLALQTPTDGRASGEGGLSLIFTNTEHASWGTFGLRTGMGYGGADQTYVTTTLWGGVRYVPARVWRNGGGDRGPIAKATGIRIVATVRRIVDPVEMPAVLFGIEFEPEYFLPPYELFKWGGKH